MITGFQAAADAAQMVADVRDDPAGRIRLAADAYAFHRGDRRYRPYRRAVVAFMRWQQARGVLNPPHDDVPGSPWWRAVNEDLLRDTVEAKLLIQRGGGDPSRPSVTHWIGFFEAPSAQSWYLAHNASVVAGYLAHSDLATFEAPAERFFMNVVLVRLLYAHALVVDGDLALGRLSFLGQLIGHPGVEGSGGLHCAERRSARSLSDPGSSGRQTYRTGKPARPDGGLRCDRRARRRSVRLFRTRSRRAAPARLDPGRSTRVRLAGRPTSRLEASATVAADIVDRIHHTAPQRHPPRTRASLEPQVGLSSDPRIRLTANPVQRSHVWPRPDIEERDERSFQAAPGGGGSSWSHA